jgi:hypothetical protein
MYELLSEEHVMKPQDLKHWRNVVISVTALLAVLLPTRGKAGPMGEAGSLVSTTCVQVTTRPLAAFLDAQGTTSRFFPPVEDMVGWDDGSAGINFGLVDYAGLANAYIEATTGTSLGTAVSGTVTECARADGTAMIAVDLNTENALGFAQSIQDLSDHHFNFLQTPTIFGAKAQDVVTGAAPALGAVQFQTTFVIGHPGDPLPDIRIAFQDNKPDVRPITLDFRSTTVGTLPDGTGASLRIHQVAATDEVGNLIFTKEIVDIHR